jgi:hypothetical protein
MGAADYSFCRMLRSSGLAKSLIDPGAGFSTFDRRIHFVYRVIVRVRQQFVDGDPAHSVLGESLKMTASGRTQLCRSDIRLLWGCVFCGAGVASGSEKTPVPRPNVIDRLDCFGNAIGLKEAAGFVTK